MIRKLLRQLSGDARLRSRVDELEAQLEASTRRLAVANAEIDSMAQVIARDRERIKAESAAYARQRAEAEGISNERDSQSTR